MIRTGDRLIQVMAADGPAAVRVQRASRQGDRFILRQTAAGKQVSIKVSPVMRRGERGILARTADGFDVLVKFAMAEIWACVSNGVRAYSFDMAEIWAADLGSVTRAIAYAPDNSLYVSVANRKVPKLNADTGIVILEVRESVEFSTYDVDADDESSVYIAGIESATHNLEPVEVYDREGDRKWAALFGLIACHQIAADSQKKAITATNVESGSGLIKMSQDGEGYTTDWFVNQIGMRAHRIQIDSGDSIVICGELVNIPESEGNLYKYDADGLFLWGVSYGVFGDVLRDIAIDADDNIIAVGDRIETEPDTFVTIRKYDPDGSVVWSRDHGADCKAVAITADGRIYVAGDSVHDAGLGGNVATRVYDGDGELLNSYEVGAGFRRIAARK